MYRGVRVNPYSRTGARRRGYGGASGERELSGREGIEWGARYWCGWGVSGAPEPSSQAPMAEAGSRW